LTSKTLEHITSQPAEGLGVILDADRNAREYTRQLIESGAL